MEIGEEELAVGREGAELNLRLAIELKRPGGKVADAHWLVGAQALARREFRLARVEFATCSKIADRAEQKEMGRGYEAIARMAIGKGGEPEFEDAVRKLRGLGSEDGKFYAEQLEGVRLWVQGSAKS